MTTSVPRLLVPIRDEFKSVPNVTSKGVSKDDWKDAQLGKLKRYKIETRGQKETYTIAKKVCEELMTGISERTVTNMIECVWNMPVSGNSYGRVFPTESEIVNDIHPECARASPTVYNTEVSVRTITYPTSDLTGLQALTYTFASMLRLITKEPSGYKLARQSINRAYLNFFGHMYPVDGFDIPDSSIEQVHSIFRLKTNVKNTIADILYYISDVGDSKGMLTMLFDMHIQNTGMTCIPLFYEAATVLSCSAQDLMNALWHRMTKVGLLEIAKIMCEFDSGDEATLKTKGRSRRTYRYARIFDDQMFAVLQNKNSLQLLMLLAHLSSMGKQKGTGNIMDMAVLKQIPQSTKDVWKGFADGIYTYFVTSEEAAEGNMLFCGKTP